MNGVSARRLGHVGTFFFGAAAAARLMGARGAEADGGGWRRKISKSPTPCKRTQMDVEERKKKKKKKDMRKRPRYERCQVCYDYNVATRPTAPI